MRTPCLRKQPVPYLHLLLRQPGSWNPLLQCLHLDKFRLEQQVQRNYEGLKITESMRSWGKLWTRMHAPSLQSCQTLCDPMDSGLYPWDSPGKNTGVGFYVLL